MFSPVSHFYPSLVFPDKAGAYQSGALSWTQLYQSAPNLALKYFTRVEVTDSNKLYSLLDFCKTYCDKNIYSTGPVFNVNFFSFTLTIRKNKLGRFAMGISLLSVWSPSPDSTLRVGSILTRKYSTVDENCSICNLRKDFFPE